MSVPGRDPQVDRRPARPARAPRAGRRAADPVRGPRADAGPAGPRRCRCRGPRRTWWRGESGGNPLFIDELVKHIQGGEPIDRWEAIGQLDLDEVLWARIQPAAGGRAAAAGRRGGLGPADPAGAGLPGQPSWAAGGRVALASLRTARLIRSDRPGPAGRDRDLPRPDPRDGRRPPAARPPAVAPPAAGDGPVQPPGRSTPRSSPAIIEGPVRPPARASTIRAAPTRPRRRWRSTTPRGSIGSPWSSIRDRRTRPGPCWKQLGDALANAGRGAEAAQAYLAAAASADGGRDPRAEAAGLDPAPDQRARRRGLALLRTLLEPLGIDHARDAPACARLAALASGDASGSAGCGFARADADPGLRRWS